MATIAELLENPIKLEMKQEASDKMIEWQYRKLMGQLLLTQEHSSDLSCPCELSSEYEYCLPKHLIAIQSYAEETMPMTENGKAREVLQGIAGGANDLRRAYEEAESEEKRPYGEITEFVRQSRKGLEPYLFVYKQPVEQLAAMKLLTKEIRDKLPPLYSQEKVEDPVVQVKFFTPDSNWTWYGIEFDGKDIFFGWVVGFEKEMGYFSLKELESARGPLGLPIERDKWFTPVRLSEVKKLHQQSGAEMEQEEIIYPEKKPKPLLIANPEAPGLKGIIPPELAATKIQTRLVRSGVYDPAKMPVIKSPSDLQPFFSKMRQADQEWLVAIYTDAHLRVLGADEVTIGGRAAGIVPVDTILRGAILLNAGQIFLAHNHPSGDPTPSDEDKVAWSRVKEAAKLFDIDVPEAMVVGSITDYSLAAEKIIPAPVKALQDRHLEELEAYSKEAEMANNMTVEEARGKLTIVSERAISARKSLAGLDRLQDAPIATEVYLERIIKDSQEILSAIKPVGAEQESPKTIQQLLQEQTILEQHQKDRPQDIIFFKDTIMKHYYPKEDFYSDSFRVVKPEPGVMVTLGCLKKNKWYPERLECVPTQDIHRTIVPRMGKYIKEAEEWAAVGVPTQHRETEVGIVPRELVEVVSGS